jgi:hypothetical protein
MSDRVQVEKKTNKDGSESVSYSKSWEKNGLHHRIEISKVDGGYIIEESKHGRPKDGGEDAEYIDERKQRVSTENPFEKEAKEDEKMFGFVDNPSLI